MVRLSERLQVEDGHIKSNTVRKSAKGRHARDLPPHNQRGSYGEEDERAQLQSLMIHHMHLIPLCGRLVGGKSDVCDDQANRSARTDHLYSRFER